jgi:uncharacterized protein (DUF924 family)
MNRHTKMELVKELLGILHDNGITDEDRVFEYTCFIHKELLNGDEEQYYDICVENFRQYVEWGEQITLKETK